MSSWFRCQMPQLGIICYKIALVVVIGLFVTIEGGVTDGPVKVTQVDPSRFPEVALYVSVTDERGLPQGGLTREDFRLVEDGKPVQIKDFAGTGQNRPVDIVFVFDTTGSMREEIEGVKNTCVAFANKLRANNRDFHLGLITFGDEIRDVRNADGVLTADAEEFKGWIGRQKADGGGDDAEIALDALERATRMKYRPGTQKVLILITDAPPHQKNDGTRYSQVIPDDLTVALRDGGNTVYAVTYDDARFRKLAQETHGEFYKLTPSADFTGIIDKIGGQIAVQYRMTYLSARPSYDGTRRAIEIEVGGQKAEGTYLEKHLINVRSSLVIAALMLIPLLLALALPASARVWKARPARLPAAAQGREGAVAPEVKMQEMRTGAQVPSDAPQPLPPAAQSSGQIACPKCGNSLRSGAKFCSRCGQTIATQASALPHPPEYCPSCGSPLRPGARFCGVCGHRMG